MINSLLWLRIKSAFLREESVIFIVNFAICTTHIEDWNCIWSTVLKEQKNATDTWTQGHILLCDAVWWVCKVIDSVSAYTQLLGDAFHWRFNKWVNESGYSVWLCRQAPWGCFTLEDSLYERPGSHPHGLSYTRPLWPRTQGAKCKSDNGDNCLLKIIDSWLRSMTFPNSEAVYCIKWRWNV